MPLEIAVVVPTFRRPDRLRRLVSALAKQTLEPERWELVVVDDCSNDPEVDNALRELPQIVPCRATSLSTPRNGGPAVARNVGWRATNAPVIAFIDDDVVPDSRWLEAALPVFDDSRVGVAQGRTSLPDGVDWMALPPWYSWRTIQEEGAFFEGCNIFYRRAALEATTGFDEELAWWGEDTTVGWQVLEGGWTRAFAGASLGVHDVERKPLRWWLRNGLLEHHLVELARRHPGFRREAFWRPWAFRQRDAAFVLAVASLVVGLRWPLAAVGVLPYMWVGAPARHHRHPRALVELGLVDAARSAGQLAGAVRNRVLVV
jgi:glycosyltransferase involved in cell wall biosynthesis